MISVDRFLWYKINSGSINFIRGIAFDGYGIRCQRSDGLEIVAYPDGTVFPIISKTIAIANPGFRYTLNTEMSVATLSDQGVEYPFYSGWPNRRYPYYRSGNSKLMKCCVCSAYMSNVASGLSYHLTELFPSGGNNPFNSNFGAIIGYIDTNGVINYPNFACYNNNTLKSDFDSVPNIYESSGGNKRLCMNGSDFFYGDMQNNTPGSLPNPTKLFGGNIQTSNFTSNLIDQSEYSGPQYYISTADTLTQLGTISDFNYPGLAMYGTANSTARDDSLFGSVFTGPGLWCIGNLNLVTLSLLPYGPASDIYYARAYHVAGNTSAPNIAGPTQLMPTKYSGNFIGVAWLPYDCSGGQSPDTTYLPTNNVGPQKFYQSNGFFSIYRPDGTELDFIPNNPFNLIGTNIGPALFQWIGPRGEFFSIHRDLNNLTDFYVAVSGWNFSINARYTSNWARGVPLHG